MNQEEELPTTNETTTPGNIELDHRTTGHRDQRKRISKACDRCRSQKDKCDGRRPVCSSCAAHNHTCTYDIVSKKRGLPEGYVRGLKKLWGLAVYKLPSVDDDVALILNGADGEISREDIFLLWKDEESADSLLEKWTSSKIAQVFEKLLPELESGQPFSNKRKRSSIEPRQQTEGAIFIPASSENVEDFDTNKRYLEEHLTTTPRQTANSPPLRYTQPFSQSETNDIQLYDSLPGLGKREDTAVVKVDSVNEFHNFKLPIEAPHLLEIYMTHTHCWFPIVERYDLMRISYQYSNSASLPSAALVDFGYTAALWAVLAYSGYQNFIFHKIENGNGNHEERRVLAEKLISQAESFIPSKEAHFNLGHVQALLILALLYIGRGDWRAAWMSSGRASRAAVDLGLDTDDSHADVDSPKINSRKKNIILGCFFIDTLVSVRLGRRPYLNKEDVDKVGFVEEDGLEEWEPWTGSFRQPNDSKLPNFALSTFNHILKLVQILNQVSQDRYSSTMDRSALEMLLQKLYQLCQICPEHLKIDVDDSLRQFEFHPQQLNFNLVLSSTFAIIYMRLKEHYHSRELFRLQNALLSQARKTSTLLNAFHQSLTSLSLPPTLELSTFVILQSIASVQISAHDLSDWKVRMSFLLKFLEQTWPVFKSSTEVFRSLEQISSESVSTSTVPEFMTEILQPSEAIGINSLFNEFPPQFGNGLQIRSVGERPANPVLQNPVQNAPISQFSMNPSIGSTSTHSVPLQHTFPNTAMNKEPHNIEHPSTVPYAPEDRAILSNIESGNNDIHQNTIFHQFASLDATQWSENWSQSLRNLGFTDFDNLSQEWNQYCREPDTGSPYAPFFGGHNM